MHSSSPHPPRFVPTLTEIVKEGELVQPPPAAMSAPDDRLGSALRHIDRVIERRVRAEVDALVRTVVADQMEGIRLRLHAEFEALVRDAATQAQAESERPSEGK